MINISDVTLDSEDDQLQRDLGCDKVLFPDGGFFGIFERTGTCPIIKIGFAS